MHHLGDIVEQFFAQIFGTVYGQLDSIWNCLNLVVRAQPGDANQLKSPRATSISVYAFHQKQPRRLRLVIRVHARNKLRSHFLPPKCWLELHTSQVEEESIRLEKKKVVEEGSTSCSSQALSRKLIILID